MGKTEIVIDLNPLSRSPQVTDVPIVDNIIRAVPNITEHARELAAADEDELRAVLRVSTGIGRSRRRRNGSGRAICKLPFRSLFLSVFPVIAGETGLDRRRVPRSGPAWSD